LVAREVQELVDIDEPHPLTALTGPERTMRKPSLLRFHPRPQVACHIVRRWIHGIEDLLNVIIAVVVIDEPPLHADVGVVDDPFPEEPCLVAQHGAYTH
jgi:hypothetical protein